MHKGLQANNIEISMGSASPNKVNTSNQGTAQTANGGLHTYAVEKIIGQGSFATVYLAVVQETGEKVAIKKALQEKKYKNRELQNLKILGDHPNIVNLKTAFYIVGQNDEIFINFVTEYIPETLAQVMKGYRKAKKQISNNQIKVLAFQLLRAMSYIHNKLMVHRDLKPQNILVDTSTMQLKICDFGSAKVILKGQQNTSYLCARYYRAPELIFGSTDYTTAIDMWSVGCILAEMILLEPLFPGESSVDQLVEIMKVLGSPTLAEIQSFNVQNIHDFRFPQVKAHPWSKVFLKYKPDIMLADLIKRLLVYVPSQRIKPFDALQHAYFDDLRDKSFQDNQVMPELWNLTPEEIQIYGLQSVKTFVPDWALSRVIP